MDNISFILASGSPRRRELLGLMGYPFEVVVSGIDEDAHMDTGPANYVLQTARHKAEAISQSLSAAAIRPVSTDTRQLIIAADTTVALGNNILGKPASADEARAMLAALRDRTHEVYTGVCVIDPAGGREAASVQATAVTMRPYTDAEIDAYIATGDPFDKAGAYGIQHPVFRCVARLEGCYLGVMGLSLCDLIPLLRQLDIPDRFDPAELVDAHRGHVHEIGRLGD